MVHFPDPEPDVDVEPEPSPEPTPSPNSARTVHITVRATKDDLHTLQLALGGLRELVGDPGTMSIELRVDADAGDESIDRARFRNMVLQHLEEDPDVSFVHRLE